MTTPVRLGQSRYKGARSTASRAPDPPHAGRFTLKIGNEQLGSFMEVTGLSVSVEVEDLVEGGHNEGLHRLPGRLKWPNLVLKRGITDNDALFAWIWRTSGQGYAEARDRSAPARPAIVPLDGSISVCDSRSVTVRTWSFRQAFPVRWSGPKLAASSSELATEELEICHHGFTSTTAARP